MQDCQADAQAVEQVLDNMKVNENDVEHMQDFLALFLSMEARPQVQVQDYDVNRNVHGLCGDYDCQVVNGWNVPLEVQQLECHVLYYGCWENVREKQQVLLHMCYLQERNGDAFALKVPQLELHGSSHVYYEHAWNGDAFLSKVLQRELHGPSHGWRDGLMLLEKLLVFALVAYLQAMEGKI